MWFLLKDQEGQVRKERQSRKVCVSSPIVQIETHIHTVHRKEKSWDLHFITGSKAAVAYTHSTVRSTHVISQPKSKQHLLLWFSPRLPGRTNLNPSIGLCFCTSGPYLKPFLKGLFSLLNVLFFPLFSPYFLPTTTRGTASSGDQCRI